MMNDQQRVWISARKCRGGRTAYHLRWIDPVAHKWKSQSAGRRNKPCTDRKRALKEAAKLEDKLNAGTYREVKRSTWQEFTAEHVATIPGERNRAEAERALKEFGKLMSVASPRRVEFGTVEDYRSKLRGEGHKNGPATINKKCRYLRKAFRWGVRRRYLGQNPMEGWQWVHEDQPELRIATAAEETALLTKAQELYGSRWHAFIQTALATGGRCGELVGLTWGTIDLGHPETAAGASVLFTHTKGKRDRRIPISPELAGNLRKLQPSTLQEGGPFAGMADNLRREWGRICKQAKVEGLSLHDLRRTFVTRLLRHGARMEVVQELAGHADIATTRKYYTQVIAEDRRATVALLWTPAAPEVKAGAG